MTKSKAKPATRDTVQEDIKSRLITELKTLTDKFGEASEKLEKEINKGAKKFAKKIAKKLNIKETPAPKEAKAAKAPKAQDKATKAESKASKTPAKPAKAPVAARSAKTAKAPAAVSKAPVKIVTQNSLPKVAEKQKTKAPVAKKKS